MAHFDFSHAVTHLKTGSATVTATNTYVDVTHGLNKTPSISDIQVTSQTWLDGRDFWTSNVGAVTFRINISGMDILTAFVFSWVIFY